MIPGHLIFGSGASACKDFNGLLDVCRAALSKGITMFDTAPSYRTEVILCQAVTLGAKDFGFQREDFQIQTKIDPIQMYNGHIEEYFENKLLEMQLDYVDSLLIHWPIPNYLFDTWECLLRLKEKGYTKRIGICNLRVEQLNELKDRGIIPEILQVERHPLNIFNKETIFCKDNNIQLQDYSPLCKMHPMIRDNKEILKIAEKYDSNVGQIVLKWHIDTGAMPVFTTTKPSRVIEYSNIDKIHLTLEEIEVINSLNCNHKLYLESLICPGI